MNKEVIYILIIFFTISCKSYKYNSNKITNYIYTTDSFATYTKRFINNVGIKLIINEILQNKIKDSISFKDSNIVLFNFHSFSLEVIAYHLTKKDTIEYIINFDPIEGNIKRAIIINNGYKSYKYSITKNNKLTENKLELLREGLKTIYDSQDIPSKLIKFDGSTMELILKFGGFNNPNYKHYSLKTFKKIKPSKSKIYFIN